MPRKPKRRGVWLVKGLRRIPTSPKLREIVRLLEQGESYGSIANSYGMTKEAVRNIRVKTGLPGRKVSESTGGKL